MKMEKRKIYFYKYFQKFFELTVTVSKNIYFLFCRKILSFRFNSEKQTALGKK